MLGRDLELAGDVVAHELLEKRVGGIGQQVIEADAAADEDLFDVRQLAELAQQRLGIAFEPDAVHAHIPFIWSRLNSLGFDFTVNPTAAARTGSSVSAPMETLPSATSVRNLMAEL